MQGIQHLASASADWTLPTFSIAALPGPPFAGQLLALPIRPHNLHSNYTTLLGFAALSTSSLPSCSAVTFHRDPVLFG